MGKTRDTGKLATQIQFDNNNNLIIGSSPSSILDISGSIEAGSITGSFTGSVFGLGDVVSFSSSVNSDLNSIHNTTSSNITKITNLEEKTGSLATTGSNTFFGTQTFSGSVYIANDLIVQGSSSIQYITGSSVNIGTNIVQLNTANPSIRFAGLTIIDSGSIGGSGSFLYDSVQDEFIFVHRGNNTNVTSSHFVLGPETYDNLGNESYLTCNRLTKGTGKEHLVDSSIFDDGTTVCVNANLKGNGQVCSLMGNFSCIGVGTITPVSKLTVYDSTDVEIRLQTVNTGTTSVDGFNIGLQNSSCDVYLNQRENANLFLNTSGSIRLSINGGGCVGIGTQSPTLALSVIGQVRAGYATGAGLTIGLSPIGVPNNDLNAYVIWGDAASFGDNNGDLIYIPRSSTTAHHRFYTANVGLATEKMRITYDGKLGINTITPCTILHAVIQTCYGANGTVANSHPVATFSQCDCGAGARGLQIGVPTGGVNSPVFLKISNTGVRFAILDQSNCENFTISGVNVGIVCTSPGVSLVIGGTDALKLPTGTTAQRPTGAAGLVRMNTTTGQPEWYNTTTSTWASFNQNVNNYLVEYLVVGGGGGGGYDNGAGGGAGGFVLDCGLSVSSCASYSVIVGAGGSATTGVSGFGGASCFNGVVALGGGGGGGQTNIGGDGGSGGGSMYYPIGAIRGGFGTIGQGFEGGCWTTLSSPWIGAGGGGASQRGFDGPFNGMGGAGKPSTLLGNTCYYAGGGNGSGDSPGCQTQPLGGGGIAGNPTGGNGSTNSGGGGGGGINGGNFGGNGGSGVVIIRYPGCQRGSGGTICSYCGTTIHVFTSSGTFIA